MSWSSIDLTSQCLADGRRTELLLEAINATVNKSDVVADLGTGTGVLAREAAKHTRKNVYAVESDQDVFEFLNKLSSKQPSNLKIVNADAACLSEIVFDVVVAELIDIWLLCEDLATVLRSLAERGCINEKTRFIPVSYVCSFDLGVCDWSWDHQKLKWPYYEWPFYSAEGWRIPNFRATYSVEDFEVLQMYDVAFNGKAAIKRTLNLQLPTKTGFNAIRLRGHIMLGNQIRFDVSNALNAPMVVPLEGFSSGGMVTELRLEAKLGGGLRSLCLAVDGTKIL